MYSLYAMYNKTISKGVVLSILLSITINLDRKAGQPVRLPKLQ